jgi:hypothetical protein
MRAQEFLAEKKIATFRSGNLQIDVDDHAIEQTYMRSVDPKHVDQALKKLRLVTDQLNSVEPGQKIWARDSETGIALGLRKLAEPNKFLFATVVGSLTYDSGVQVIELSTDQQLDELSFLGSPCTKDCSGHRAGYAWSRARGNVHAASWSPSFNNGAALAVAGK